VRLSLTGACLSPLLTDRSTLPRDFLPVDRGAGGGAAEDGRALYNAHAAADGQGVWILSDLPRRWVDQNQAITAMVLVERLAAGLGDDDLFVIGWREELEL
jgi:hypothetical protein